MAPASGFRMSESVLKNKCLALVIVIFEVSQNCYWPLARGGPLATGIREGGEGGCLSEAPTAKVDRRNLGVDGSGESLPERDISPT